MQIIDALAEVSDRYRALFVDLWGCVHDGVRALPGAVEALEAYRARGGRVILVTNSPRTRAGVAAQIAHFGVPGTAYDDIATSGDSARVAMFDGVVGGRVWHLGQAHDAAFFEPPAILERPRAIERVALDAAEGIVCTGPLDPMVDPDVLRPEFQTAIAGGLKLLCANPDIVVDRGEIREWCAGALAALYTDMGGESLYFGKPHPPIYDLARRRLAKVEAVPDAEILAIGDGPGTDAAGAMGEKLDLLFISGGLAATETGTSPSGRPDADRLQRFLDAEGLAPTYTIGRLR
ncbi:TIGR01459 family HAD-type hydrolase [uncultured Jannaschia sp.]|uniref:TIGR01459 family HAD-type hydrolase n=1 Tax=uncultured Jannaschia sp. TaxID=293347 RepID=UPI0026235771|nr:TIGR01459 family HAD-type hydrolase [uncultured Jannaschia sp.]